MKTEWCELNSIKDFQSLTSLKHPNHFLYRSHRSATMWHQNQHFRFISCCWFFFFSPQSGCWLSGPVSGAEHCSPDPPRWPGGCVSSPGEGGCKRPSGPWCWSADCDPLTTSAASSWTPGRLGMTRKREATRFKNKTCSSVHLTYCPANIYLWLESCSLGPRLSLVNKSHFNAGKKIKQREMLPSCGELWTCQATSHLLGVQGLECHILLALLLHL